MQCFKCRKEAIIEDGFVNCSNCNTSTKISSLLQYNTSIKIEGEKNMAKKEVSDKPVKEVSVVKLKLREVRKALAQEVINFLKSKGLCAEEIRKVSGNVYHMIGEEIEN